MIYAGLSSDLDNSLQAAVFGSQDTRPPEIILRGWTDKQTVYLEKVYLEGQVKDEHHVVGLEINSKPILKRKGKFILFSQFIELAEGENQIAIRARDEKGHVAEKTISIIRRIPQGLAAGGTHEPDGFAIRSEGRSDYRLRFLPGFSDRCPRESRSVSGGGKK